MSPNAIVLRAPMSSAPISNEHQFTGILEVLSMRHEAINNHPYAIRDMSFHLFTQVMIHLDFLSHGIFSCPKIVGFFYFCVYLHWMPNIGSLILTFVLHIFFLYHLYCLLCTFNFLPSIRHAIFVQFYKHLKLQKCPIVLIKSF
jgi:hypothetical protein